MVSPGSEVFSLKKSIQRLQTHYETFVLVTHRDQLRDLSLEDESELIVCCDWLLWQQLLADGRNAAHYELGIADWIEADTIDEDLNIRANDWIYDRDRDLTRFKGVSLGSYFNGDVGWCLVSLYRMEHSLSNLIKRFSPKKIHFFDYRNDINLLRFRQRRRLVQRLAEDFGIAFRDLSQNQQSESFLIFLTAFFLFMINLLVLLLFN